MLLKLVSFIASILLLFTSFLTMPQKPDVLIEVLDNLSENRTADEINGAGGTKFYIQRPKSEMLTEVNASDFGLSESSEDNFTAFQNALNYCSGHPQTKLVIDKGTYYFKSLDGLDANNCTDLLIEGNGATFIFSSTGYKFFIRNSDCVEIRNLNFDWNCKKVPSPRLSPFRTVMLTLTPLTLFSKIQNTAMKTTVLRQLHNATLKHILSVQNIPQKRFIFIRMKQT